MGLVPMHIGDGAPPIRVPMAQERHLDMDGALRAPAQSDGTLDQIPVALRAGLVEVTRTLADAADGVLDGQELVDASRQPVGPPVYTSSHVRRWKVRDPQDPAWFRELNLDPRARVAAGLGTECVRVNQEDIVNAAWRQVGDVLAAEAALQRAALGDLMSRSFFRRHVDPMPHHYLIALAAPVAARTPFAGVSVTAGIARSSLPDAVVDGGFRRALAPAGRAVARAARRIGVPADTVRPELVVSLANGRDDLDATRFARPVLTGAPVDTLTGDDLSGLGIPVRVGSELIARLNATARALAGLPVDDAARLSLRPEVRSAGLIGQAHVEAARVLAAHAADALTAAGGTRDAVVVGAVGSAALLDLFATQSVAAQAGSPGAGAGVGFLVQGPAVSADGTGLDLALPAVTVGVLDVDAGNTLVLRSAPGLPNVPVAMLDAAIPAADISGLLGRLDVGVLQRSADSGVDRARLPRIGAGVVVADQGGVVRSGGIAPLLAVPVGPGAVQPGGVQPGAGQPGVVEPGAVQPGGVVPGRFNRGRVQPGGVVPGGFDLGRVERGRGLGAGVGVGAAAVGDHPGRIGRDTRLDIGLSAGLDTGLNRRRLPGGPVVVGPVGEGPVIAGPLDEGDARLHPIVVGEFDTSLVVDRPVVTQPADPIPALDRRSSIVMPPLIRDERVVAQFEAALALQQQATVITTAVPVGTVVPFNLGSAAAALKTHLDPAVAQPLRRDALVQLAGRSVADIRTADRHIVVDGWWATPALDRIMAYPTFPVARLGVPVRLRPHPVLPGRGQHSDRLGHAAGDQSPVHRRVHGRPQPRDEPRTAVARLPHRQPGHPVPPLLASSRRQE